MEAADFLLENISQCDDETMNVLMSKATVEELFDVNSNKLHKLPMFDCESLKQSYIDSQLDHCSELKTMIQEKLQEEENCGKTLSNSKTNCQGQSSPCRSRMNSGTTTEQAQEISGCSSNGKDIGKSAQDSLTTTRERHPSNTVQLISPANRPPVPISRLRDTPNQHIHIHHHFHTYPCATDPECQRLENSDSCFQEISPRRVYNVQKTPEIMGCVEHSSLNKDHSTSDLNTAMLALHSFSSMQSGVGPIRQTRQKRKRKRQGQIQSFHNDVPDQWTVNSRTPLQSNQQAAFQVLLDKNTECVQMYNDNGNGFVNNIEMRTHTMQFTLMHNQNVGFVPPPPNLPFPQSPPSYQLHINQTETRFTHPAPQQISHFSRRNCPPPLIPLNRVLPPPPPLIHIDQLETERLQQTYYRPPEPRLQYPGRPQYHAQHQSPNSAPVSDFVH